MSNFFLSLLILLSSFGLTEKPSYSSTERIIDQKMCSWMCDYFRNYVKGTINASNIYHLSGNEYRAVGTYKWSGFSTHTGDFRATITEQGNGGRIIVNKICITGWGDDRDKEHCKRFD